MSLVVRNALPTVNPVRAGFPVVRQSAAPNEMRLSYFGQAEEEGVMGYLKNPWVAGGLGVVLGMGALMVYQRSQGY